MKKHGPAFKKAVIDLSQCPECRGMAVVKGVFHEMACVQCNASGWVVAATGHALPVDELVIQLSLRLQAAQRQIEQLNKPVLMGPAAQYQQNNRRGAGGTNYTGD